MFTTDALATRYVVVARNGDFLPAAQASLRCDFDTLDEARALINTFHNPGNYRVAVINYLD